MTKNKLILLFMNQQINYVLFKMPTYAKKNCIECRKPQKGIYKLFINIDSKIY